jgi:putative DNA primase/helicase
MFDVGGIIESFRQAMEQADLFTSDEIIADGKLHRFHVEGDSPGKENGWYILHVDENPAGQFGSWKTNLKQTWTARVERKLTRAEREQLERRISEQRAEREREEAKQYAASATIATHIWESSPDAPEDFAYLVRKGLRASGLKFGETSFIVGRDPVTKEPIRIKKPCVIVPVYSPDGQLTTLQFISKEGDKKFLYGGRIDSCYAIISRSRPSLSGPIAICEGYATAASIHAATEWPVVVAFNSGNLLPVAQVIRRKFPEARLVICADNDQWTERPVKNPGLFYGMQAAQAVNGHLALPEFKRTETKPTDFNDLAQEEGLPRVAEIIEAAIPSQAQEPSPELELVKLERPFNSSTQFGVEIPGQASGVHSAPLPGEESHPEFLEPGRYPVIIDFPDLDGKGRPLATIENVRKLLDHCKIRVQYDVIRKDIEIHVPSSQFLIDTARNDKITHIVSLANRARLPSKNIPEYVSYIAGQNPVNPVADWIRSKAWDGVSRLQEFFNTVQALDEDDNELGSLKETLMRRWMLSAVAAAMRPNGVSAHGVLVFQGDQYLGKTAWFKSLVPAELKELVADGMLLDPKDKDSVYQIVTHWLVELGEVDATFRRSDIAQLKSFLTKDRDVLRRPYARAESAFARRTVFFASVNPDTYLSDPTGNRRFWTIACEKINYQHGLDMQQVWAEFFSLYEMGESWYLTAGEMEVLNRHNKGFEEVQPIDEMLAAHLDWDEPRTIWQRKTLTQIALDIGIERPVQKDLKQISKYLRDRLKLHPTKSGGQRHYLVPALRRHH